MRYSFTRAKRILRTSGGKDEIVAINGCCYGRDDSPDKGDYFKLCGQRFWELVSGDSELYTRIIEPLGHQAKAQNDEFMSEYAKIINNLTSRFVTEFCNLDGAINWSRLVEYNSKKSM